MKRIWVSLIGAGLLMIAAIAPAAGQSIFSVPLDDVEDSGISGGASIRGVDGQTEVTVFISEGETDGDHPVHVHEGTCEDLGDVVYPLENITEGESVTTLDIELSELMTGEYAINAHQSEDDISTFIMCGNVPEVEGLGAGEDEESADEGDEESTDEGDEAAEEDEEATEDEGDDAADEDMDDEQAAEDEEGDDEEEVGDLAPDAGAIDGTGSDVAVMLMMMLAAGSAGAGLLMRSRFARA